MVGIIKLLPIRRYDDRLHAGAAPKPCSRLAFFGGNFGATRVVFGGLIKETSNFEDNKTEALKKFVNKSGNKRERLTKKIINETISTKYTATGATICGDLKLKVKKSRLTVSHEVGEN